MKKNLKIRRDDTVIVIAGKHRGKVGKVVRVHPADERVVIEGVARVKRHVKPQGDQRGSIVEKEAAIHVSNVALWNADEGRRVRPAFRAGEDGGKKVRVDRKTGAAI
jgi:large subunit ribosomal protein L24